MRLLPELNPKSGEFVINASLNKCVKLVDTFPRRWKWQDHKHGYGVDDNLFIAPNKYRYKVYVWKYNGNLYRNFLSELTIQLEGIDEYTTRLRYVSKIARGTLITCMVLIIVGTLFFFVGIPLALAVIGFVILFMASDSKNEWIEIHHQQFQQIEKPF